MPCIDLKHWGEGSYSFKARKVWRRCHSQSLNMCTVDRRASGRCSCTIIWRWVNTMLRYAVMILVRGKLIEAVEKYDELKQMVILMWFRCGHVAVGKASLMLDYNACKQLGKDYYQDVTAGALELHLDDVWSYDLFRKQLAKPIVVKVIQVD